MTRRLSYSEVETALTCYARWDFAYSDRLAGSSLKDRGMVRLLSEGRAWGAAMAAWHRSARSELFATWEAHRALAESIAADVAEAEAAGFHVDEQELAEISDRLAQMLEHYIATAEPLGNLTLVEGELDVPLPARRGGGPSSRYRFVGRIDGYTIDADGHQWIVEFKLRNRLQPAWLVQRSRQIRWYAWALARTQGEHAPIGVIVDERLNEVPKPARVLKGGKPSHARDQMTTPERYLEACALYGVEAQPETVEALRLRDWHNRIRLPFAPGELDQAGRELVSAAKLIRDLDSGELEPIRNPAITRCQGCRYRDICDHPEDAGYVDTLFERVQPKRRRRDVEVAA